MALFGALTVHTTGLAVRRETVVTAQLISDERTNGGASKARQSRQAILSSQSTQLA
jgi:hypothetical protein